MRSTGGRSTTPNVLIVEDDEDLRGVLAEGLRGYGFEVHTAGTADEAFEWAQREDLEIDVIVLDIVLPDSWGSQVALSHNAFQPETCTIYISGHVRDDAVLRATVAGDQVPFLEKPFRTSELADLIGEILEKRDSVDHAERQRGADRRSR